MSRTKVMLRFATAAAAAVIAALGTGLYANSLHAPFVFDDLQNIATNPLLRVSDWNFEALRRAAFESPSPRPVANLSFVLSWAQGGGDPFPFHVFNVAVHVVNAWLVGLLAWRVLADSARVSGRALDRRRRFSAATTAALLFVCHPIATQAVTYSVQRMTSLAVGFSLLAFLAYLRAREAPTRGRRLAWWSAAALGWALALGSKQIAAPLPLLAIAYEWFFRQDLSRAWLRHSRAWLFAVAAAVLAGVAAVALWHDFALKYDHRSYDLVERQLTQFRVLWFYLGLIAFPAPWRLNLTHDFDVSHSLIDPLSTGFALLGLLGLAGAGAVLARRERLLAFTILCFFGTLALESSIIALELVYEHRLYFPMVWIAILAADTLFRLSSPRLALVIAALVIAALSTWTIERNALWREAIALWRDAAEKSPRDHRARNNYGDALMAEGRVADARREFERAVELAPGYTRAQHNLAIALHRSGELALAIERYRLAVEQDPTIATLQRNLGTALEAGGDAKGALEAYSRATRLAPGYARAHHDLGVLRIRTGDAAGAEESLRRACALAPDDHEFRHSLGLLQIARGDFEAAVSSLERAARMKPSNASYRVPLALALARSGERERALGELREALRLDPNSTQARQLLQTLEAGR